MPPTRITGQQVKDAGITHDDIAAANIDGAAATPSMRTLGTGSAQACAGDDARLVSNPVSAASTFGTDNRIIRSDGTGRGVQASDILLADNNQVTFPEDVYMLKQIHASGNVNAAGLKTINGLYLSDSDFSSYLIVKAGSNLSTDRILTINTGDASRALTLSGDATISGTNAGDQTITLTGDVTGSGTGSFAATVASASDTVAGKIEVATQNEVEAGTSTTLAITPARQQYHPSAAKGWINFNGSATIASRASYNVSGITDNGAGTWNVQWDVDFSSANYEVQTTGQTIAGTLVSIINVDSTDLPATTDVGVVCYSFNGVSIVLYDSPYVFVAAHGDQ